MPHPRGQEPEKKCAQCGKPMVRKVINGRLEDLGVFNRRKFCDQTCMGLAKRKEVVGWSAHHWRARKLRKSACEACGERRSLVAHHVDQDEANNDPGNIQTLCSWCHDFWHSTARRLGRPIAGRMPRLSAMA